jgi:hypothetical protein
MLHNCCTIITEGICLPKFALNLSNHINADALEDASHRCDVIVIVMRSPHPLPFRGAPSAAVLSAPPDLRPSTHSNEIEISCGP